MCKRCGVPFHSPDDTDHLCGRCILHPPAFASARACAVYDSADGRRQPLRGVIHQLKYDRRIAVARPLRRILAERAPASFAGCEVLLPVPLHRDRLRWRGFNQALVLARDLARDKCIPVAADVLVRSRPTRPQVGLDPSLRAANVAGAFSVVQPERIRQRRVLLVDDVMTTGSTVDACAAALRRAGARQVEVLVLARAVRD